MVLGANGVLGNQLAKKLQEKNYQVVGCTRKDFDMNLPHSLENLLKSHSDYTVLNCVGFMPADKCELDPGSSKVINLDFPVLLSSLIEQNKRQKLIHFSTDFIFDGKSNIPYVENSKASPLNTYGKHKLESENKVIEILESRTRVIRFASLISTSSSRKTFIEKIIDRAKSDGKVSLVQDLRISIATDDLIVTTSEHAFDFEKTILHSVHSGTTSWLEIASRVLNHLQIDVEISPVQSSSFTTAAVRPQFSALKPSDEVMNLDSRDWDQALGDFVQSNYQHL